MPIDVAAVMIITEFTRALTQTEGAAEISPPFVKPTMNLGGSDGGRAQGIVVPESFECVCALGPLRPP